MAWMSGGMQGAQMYKRHAMRGYRRTLAMWSNGRPDEGFHAHLMAGRRVISRLRGAVPPAFLFCVALWATVERSCGWIAAMARMRLEHLTPVQHDTIQISISESATGCWPAIN